MLALGYSDFISLGFDHSAFEASWYQAINCCSQSLCFPQNSLSIFLAITLNLIVLPKVKKSYQIGKFILSLHGEERRSSITANVTACCSRFRRDKSCWHFIMGLHSGSFMTIGILLFFGLVIYFLSTSKNTKRRAYRPRRTSKSIAQVNFYNKK